MPNKRIVEPISATMEEVADSFFRPVKSAVLQDEGGGVDFDRQKRSLVHS